MTPIGGHAVFLLLVQIALLLTVARFGSELAKRVGLPPVVGELASGIALGPSLFGHFWPGAFGAVFPKGGEQHHLLEVVGNLGMVLLLLLTGLETDLRLLRNLGRAATIASVLGMAIPFASGYGLGMWMPEQYVAQPNHRTLFALFMATAMSISAMPVIAKILMDLGLTKRNLGLVILSAGVVDDTAGWLVLSLIAGAATKGVVKIADLGKTVLEMAGFIAGAFLVLPIIRRLMGFVREMRTKDSDLVLIVVMALLCGALTEHIGIHAVFGAFVAGTMLRQVPRLSHETVERLESFVFSILAPVFFGIVGLKVDLWALGSPGMLLVVLGVACVGKLLGCTLGAAWGGLRFWESLSIAVAMNARGAMELVVATIGLSLGILNQQTFSIIVVVAIVTSFMAPIGLRFTVPRVRITEDEEKRIAESQSKLAFDIAKIRALLPTAGGEPSLGAAILTGALTKRSGNAVEVLHVDATSTFWQRVSSMFREPERTIDEHLKAVRELAVRANVRRISASDVPMAIVDAASKGFDLLVLGAKDMGSALLADVVERAPCHVVIFHANEAPTKTTYRRVIVPIEGGAVSRVALEVAVRYAEATDAELTLALVEQRPRAASIVEPSGSDPAITDAVPVSNTDLLRMSGVFRTSKLKPEILRLGFDPTGRALGQVVEGGFDLVIVGAENRAIQHRLFFGYETERLLRKSALPIAIVVPNMAKLVG